MKNKEFHMNTRYQSLALFGALGLFCSLCSLASPSGANAADPKKTEVEAVASATPTPAEEEESTDGKKKEKKEKVVTGVIAAQGTYGQFANVKAETAGSSPGDEGGVIAGSVSWAPGDICKAVITNNGEKDYSVYFVVNGVSQTGSKVFSKTASGTVKSKSSMTREIFGCKREVNLSLDLRSAKALK